MPKTGPRRKKCDAFKVFEKNLRRSRAFITLFDAPASPGQPSNTRKELLRASVVFGVGALDAFLHDLVLEIVPRYGPKSRDLADGLRAIAKEDPGLALRVALAPTVNAGREEFRLALDDWMSAKSFQGPAKLTTALSYTGCAIDWPAFDKQTGLNTAERLAHYTEMRHQIVHRGESPPIVRANAAQCVNLVHVVATLVNAAAVKHYH